MNFPPPILIKVLLVFVSVTRIVALSLQRTGPQKPQSLHCSSQSSLNRGQFLAGVGAVASVVVSGGNPNCALAFEGGVGGLGKTKPLTGVTLFEEGSPPIQNSQGIVSAEIQSVSGRPILVRFQTPWPLLPTAAGLEARDLRSSESAFVQVIPATKDWQERKAFQELLIQSVLASQGKFGAYGTPTDIRVKPLNKETGIYAVTFTSYTPAMRESERQLWIKPTQIEDTLIMLLVGTTRNSFSSQEKIFSKVMSSYEAVAAPETRLRKKPVSIE